LNDALVAPGELVLLDQPNLLLRGIAASGFFAVGLAAA